MPTAPLPTRLAALLGQGPRRHDELVRDCPDVRASSVSVALKRMRQDGRVELEARGVYRLAPDGGRGAAPSEPEVRRALLALAPGETTSYAKCARETGAGYGSIGNVLRALVRAGEMGRVARGVYARSGALPVPGGVPLPRTEQVRKIMGSEGRVWTTGEVQARLHAPTHRNEAAWLLHGMSRSGGVARVGVARWAMPGAAAAG